MQHSLHNIFGALSNVLMDYAYSKDEVLHIIYTHPALHNAVADTVLANATEAASLTKQQVSDAMFLLAARAAKPEANKITMALLYKKAVMGSPDYMSLLKAVETVLWIGGIDDTKNEEIAQLIAFFEDEQDAQCTPAVIDRIKSCLQGYEEYAIETVLARKIQ
jgi:hypothetical protein